MKLENMQNDVKKLTDKYLIADISAWYTGSGLVVNTKLIYTEPGCYLDGWLLTGKLSQYIPNHLDQP